MRRANETKPATATNVQSTGVEASASITTWRYADHDQGRKGAVHGEGPHERGHGAARSSDGRLDVKLSAPGSPGAGTNPEQLFAAGWSACFESALGLAARKQKITLPADVAIDAEVDLNLADGAYFLSARLNVSVPGLAREVAQELLDDAHRLCPYSRATRGNIDVEIKLV